jgi:8-oxo-dGTP pyrophosphatase MutT (NUDIX family)
MTTVRHFTASALVFDPDLEHVLLVNHNKVGRWLYPGGHVEPNQTPAEAAVRETEEETGIRATIIEGPAFAHPAVAAHAAPYAILEMLVTDAKIGEHQHIDFVYILGAVSGELVPQVDEVSDAQWIPLTGIHRLDTPAELPALVAHAASWPGLVGRSIAGTRQVHKRYRLAVMASCPPSCSVPAVL